MPPDIFSEGSNSVVPILARISYAALVSTKKLCCLLFLFGKPALSRNESDVCPVRIEIFEVEELVNPGSLCALSDRKPQNRRIDDAVRQCGESRRGRANL